jgi:hypothetical protein
MVESVTAAELRAAYGRTVEERFSHRLTLNVPSRSNPKVVALVDRINTTTSSTRCGWPPT